MQLGPNFKLGTLMLLVVFALATLTLYGASQWVDDDSPASAEAGAGDGGIQGGPVNVKIVAKNSLFDKRTIVASVGVPVTVTLDNQDAGVLHNIAFYTNRSASTKIAGSESKPGPLVEDLRFTAPGAAGSYFFRCDVHPDTMTGAFSVR